MTIEQIIAENQELIYVSVGIITKKWSIKISLYENSFTLVCMGRPYLATGKHGCGYLGVPR